MPTKREREYYAMGYRDGIRASEALGPGLRPQHPAERRPGFDIDKAREYERLHGYSARKPKRKLSAWNKFVKANSKKPRFRYRNGKLNLKKMAIAFRKTPQGRKKRR